MITIIHGDDITSSRNYFLDTKKQKAGAVSLTAEQTNMTDLAQAFEGGGLFEETKSIFIEELFTKKKKGKELDAILAYINQQAKTQDIYLWEKKTLTPTSLKSLISPITKLFKLPQVLFRFLDSIKPNNSQEVLRLFHNTLKTADTEMAFFMLVRQFRLLLAVRENASIEEVQRLAPWQKSKLLTQAKSFSKNELVNTYIALHEIDRDAKTGRHDAPLTTNIDFLLLAL